MVKKRKVLCIIAGLAILFTFASYCSADYSAKIDSEVIKELSKEDSVAVIIETNGSYGAMNILDEGDISYKFDSEKAFAADVDENELERISKDSSVKKISYDYPIKAFLQDSVIIVNASGSWVKQLGGLNLTGWNQTVCILDTGVNYNHADLGGCYGNNNPNSACKVIGGWDFINNDADPMDDHGHGTHVSGIVAANGSINGIAPNTRIIAIKVLDSNGEGNTPGLIAGINWCVNNASKFNIGVITMSLGTSTLYSSYCDDTFSTIAAAINNAVLRNISVVAATGNSDLVHGIPRSTTSISGPACIENVTRVSASEKDDSIASYAHYSSIVKLFAPGTNINSTWTTGYALDSGTSMAAPHVAGAIALIKQYMAANGIYKKPSEIENALNATGKRITDGSSYFSRINIYDTIVSFDSVSPVVYLISPATQSASLLRNRTFVCNATDFSLKNVTFYLWNSTGIFNSSQKALSGQNTRQEFNVTNLSVGDYSWNCLFKDENGNSEFAASNYSLIVTNLAVQLVSPANDLKTNRNQSFACNLSSIATLTNVTFYLWNSTGIENISFKTINGTWNYTEFSYNFSREGNYSWNCVAYNNMSISAVSAYNYTLSYDLTAPQINILSPQNNSWQNAGRFNLSLNEGGNCNYSIDGGANVSMGSGSLFGGVNLTLSERNYTVRYGCEDYAGNYNFTNVVSFRVDLSKPNVSIDSPEDGHSLNSGGEAVFYYNVSDNLNISECALIIDGGAIAVNGSEVNLTGRNFVSKSDLDAGTHIWSINCTDIAGNIGNSSSRTIIVNSVISSAGSGGGGGGGGGSSEVGASYGPPTEVQMQEGYYQVVRKNDNVKFNIENKGAIYNHTMQILNISNGRVKIVVRSDPQYFELGSGEDKKLSLISAEYYDVLIRADFVNETKAGISIKKIHEIVEDNIFHANNGDDFGKEDSNLKSGIKRKVDYELYGLLGIIAILIWLLIYFRRKPKKKKKKN